MRFITLTFILLALSNCNISATPTPKTATTDSQLIYSQDVLHFWEAFDEIQRVETFAEKRDLINKLYIDRASEGLQAYMKLRNVNDSLYVALIEGLPQFWASVRPKTMEAIKKGSEIEAAVDRLRTHYPTLKPAEIYLFIGGLVSGGTVEGNRTLISLEISAADASVELSELEASHHAWVVPFIKASTPDNFVQMNAHEYCHTQQEGYEYNVLCKSMSEGTCDFIAELALGKPVVAHYITYGYEHLATIKAEFKEDMFTDYISDWMYGENSRGHVRDLGYFMGYAICKAYYKQAEDKQAAVKTIMELDHKDLDAVLAFLNNSGFYDEPISGPPPPPEYPQEPVLVTFKVEVLQETDEVYITGNRPELGNWDPSLVKLEKTGPLERSIQLQLQAPIEFKITQGSWEVQGRVAEGRGWNNIRTGFTGDTTLEYKILEWSE